jgi:hypothetical protein
MTDTCSSCDLDFSMFVPKGSKHVPAQAAALVVWWRTYQESNFLRKHPGCSCSVLDLPMGFSRVNNGVVLDNNNGVGGKDDDDLLLNKIRSSMRKIKLEDLGKMNATELLASIPDEDPMGRGLRDLREMEKKLSIKIIFNDDKNGNGHVYIVGDSKKLEKKVFALRNLISHYHWRLSGTVDATSTTP